jgi:hypothetical protein
MTDCRACQRLVAVVKTNGSAELLQTVELLRLADWLAQPPNDLGAWQWAEDVCLPVVQELGRRLQRQRDNQAIDVPQLLAQVYAMRKAQRAVVAAKGKSRELKLALYHQLAIAEKAIDDLIEQHYQPTLFGETP